MGEGESSSLSSEDGEQRDMVLDFSEIFRSSHVLMAVVSIDGRILQCNDEFSRVTGALPCLALPCVALNAQACPLL